MEHSLVDIAEMYPHPQNGILALELDAVTTRISLSTTISVSDRTSVHQVHNIKNTYDA